MLLHRSSLFPYTDSIIGCDLEGVPSCLNVAQPQYLSATIHSTNYYMQQHSKSQVKTTNFRTRRKQWT